MFTGLVEAVGTLASLSASGVYMRLSVRAPAFAGVLARGQSVAVSGACLTVSSFDGDLFSVDVMRETLDRTKFRSIRPGSRLNLERALQIGGRLDGHIVTGHIDGVAVVHRVRKGGEGFLLDLSLDGEMSSLLVPKGSVAVDGASLTIASFDGTVCTVSLIPETLNNTTLGDLHPGDDVNIEMDILGKYVRRLLGISGTEEGGTKKSGLSMDSLRRAGWL